MELKTGNVQRKLGGIGSRWHEEARNKQKENQHGKWLTQNYLVNDYYNGVCTCARTSIMYEAYLDYLADPNSQ